MQTVGIDRIIEHAGVAKASLYNTFGSKEELIRAYLHDRHLRTEAGMGAKCAGKGAEDIVLLAAHFCSDFASRLGKL